MTLDDLELDVARWHHDRNLIEGSSDQAQFLKLIEEVGELANSISKNKREGMIDDIGDIIVVLINIAERNHISLFECLQYAYGDIKDRKGRMIDGIFVKESDL